MFDLESHWLAERVTFLGQSMKRDSGWGRKVKKVFPCLKSDPKDEVQ